MRSTIPPATLPIFKSALQATLLAKLVLYPDRAYTAAEMVADASESRATVFRELRRLTGAGLVQTEAAGHATLYRAATGSPLYPALRELIRRTLGVEAALTAALQGMRGVEAAAIFGSWARGDLGESSDVNVLIIGTPDPEDVQRMATRVGSQAGRPITPVVWTRQELDQELAWPSGFIAEVVHDTMIPLLGEITRA